MDAKAVDVSFFKIPTPQKWLISLLVGVMYFLFSGLSIFLANKLGNVAGPWFSDAFLLAVLLRSKQPFVIGYASTAFIAALFVGKMIGTPIFANLGYSTISITGVIVAYLLIRGRSAAPIVLDQPEIGLKILIISLSVCAVSGVFFSLLTHYVSGTGFKAAWEAWMVADAIGYLILLPFYLSINIKEIKRFLNIKYSFEFLIIALICSSITYITLSISPYPLILMTFPLILAAFRLNFFSIAALCLLNILTLLAEQLINYGSPYFSEGSFGANYIFLIAVIGLLAPQTVSLLVDRRRAIEQRQNDLLKDLSEEKQLLTITLQSIDDAVITTGPEGKTTFVSPIAERILGWSAIQIIDKPITEVFKVVNEKSHAVIKNPVLLCLEKNITIKEKEGSILINRYGLEYNISYSAAPARTEEGEVVGAILVFQDITTQSILRKELSYQTTHDPLTGLLNRRQLEYALAAIARNEKSSEKKYIFGLIDLERFKIINDTAGHAAGDVLLREISNILKKTIPAGGILTRMGADIFAFALVDVTMDEAITLSENVIKAIRNISFTWEGMPYEVGASIGLVAFNPSIRLSELISAAGIACGIAKNSGRNLVSVYTETDEEASRHRTEVYVAAGIKEALQDNRFLLYAQRIQRLNASSDESQLLRYEILIRLLDKDGKIIDPNFFIPAAEHYDLMSDIDRWVVSNTLLEFKNVLAKNKTLFLQINISANSVNDVHFIDFLSDEIKQSTVDPSRICFELTETAIVNNFTKANDFVRKLQALGCSVALDDFGSGFSSYTYLKNCPVQFIKIDGSFVMGIVHNQVDRVIVDSIHRIASQTGAQTIAEYVENEETFNMLEKMGINYAQGNFIGEPIPLEALFKLLP